MRSLLRMSLAVAVVVSWALPVSSVSAQELLGLRLRVDPSVVSYTSQTAQAKDVSVPGGGTVDGPKVTSTTLGFGLLPGGLALGIGGSVNNHVNLGVSALLAIASSTTEVEGGDKTTDDQTRIGLLPFVEYVFGEATAARGFIGLHAGMSSATVTTDTGESATGSVGAIGVDAGLHYFLNEHVSLDPQVTLRYAAGSVEDVSISGTTFLVSLGLSAWLGDSKSATASAAGGASGRATSEGDAVARARARPLAQANPLSVRRGHEGTLNGTITINGVQVDLMADVTHPDVIAIRFQRMTPAHRAPTIKCETWGILLGDQRTDVTGAVYKGEPAGPGVQEMLKSHVPVAALRALAPSTSAYGQPTAAFDVCGVQMTFSISNRADLMLFFNRFDKLLALNAANATPANATEAPATDAPATDTPAPTDAPSVGSTTTPATTPSLTP